MSCRVLKACIFGELLRILFPEICFFFGGGGGCGGGLIFS